MLVLTSHDLNEEAIHIDYLIEENDRSLSLIYSSDFSCAGEEAASLEDDGDGVEINVGDAEIYLDYQEAEQVLALLLASYTKDKQKMKILRYASLSVVICVMVSDIREELLFMKS